MDDQPQLQHPAFPQPVDPHVVIWRYMSFEKFADLVKQRRLYMARADLLGDVHEGTTPAAELSYWRFLAANAKSEEQRRVIEANRQMLSDFARELRSTYYVSCWHMNPDENIAMWERYVRSSDAVAISSTYSALRMQLGRNIIEIGVMRYLDYERSVFPSVNRLQLIMHKRHFFSDEREVRAVMFSLSPFRELVEPFMNTERTGFLAPTDPSTLVRHVVLHPQASPQTAARVLELCVAHNLPEPVRSRIASTPLF